MKHVVAIAGPNGAGKSTIARPFLLDMLGITDYVNADQIARGLSEFEPESVAIAAGKQMLHRVEELAERGSSFAFETTLAGGGYARRIRAWKELGYDFYLAFFWLPDVELAIHRVAHRVATGGHSIPEEVIRMRHQRGIDNFFDVYRDLADTWGVWDTSDSNPRWIVSGSRLGHQHVKEQESWTKFEKMRSGAR